MSCADRGRRWSPGTRSGTAAGGDEGPARGRAKGSTPRCSMRPEVGRVKQTRARASVDLPEPDSPMTPKVSPACTVKLTPSTALHVFAAPAGGKMHIAESCTGEDRRGVCPHRSCHCPGSAGAPHGDRSAPCPIRNMSQQLRLRAGRHAHERSAARSGSRMALRRGWARGRGSMADRRRAALCRGSERSSAEL